MHLKKKSWSMRAKMKIQGTDENVFTEEMAKYK